MTFMDSGTINGLISGSIQGFGNSIKCMGKVQSPGLMDGNIQE
jgi:hypothetical protein